MAIMARGLDVFVDGVKVDKVVKFNTAEGWVECHSQSPTSYSTEDVGVGDLLMSRLYGFIEVSQGK